MALDYGTQHILLKYIPFSLREDLREVPGMKRMNDTVPLIVQKFIIKKRSGEVHIEMHGDEEDHIRFWQFTPATPSSPAKVSTKWKTSAGRFLPEKVSPITGTAEESVKHFLEHLLDRDGTVIKSLELNWLPSGLQFKHRIRVHLLELYTGVKFTEFAQFLLPINKVKLFSASESHGEHEVISTAANIYVYLPSSENMNLFNPRESLSVCDQDQTTTVHEMAALVKNLMRRSRPSGFQVKVYYPKCKLLQNEFVTDREIDGKWKKFEENDCYSFERNGQEIFIHCFSSLIEIHFRDKNIEQNVALSPGPSNIALSSSSVPQQIAPSVSLPSRPASVVKVPETEIDKVFIKCENGKVSQFNMTGGDLATPFSSCIPSKTIINHLEIEGFCNKKLFDASIVLAKNLTLKSIVPFPADFFDMFANEQFDLLTATCEETLKNGQRLRGYAKEVKFLNAEEMVEEAEDDETAEPPQKKMKKSQ